MARRKIFDEGAVEIIQKFTKENEGRLSDDNLALLRQELKDKLGLKVSARQLRMSILRRIGHVVPPVGVPRKAREDEFEVIFFRAQKQACRLFRRRMKEKDRIIRDLEGQVRRQKKSIAAREGDLRKAAEYFKKKFKK